jgi:hypothetical protein
MSGLLTGCDQSQSRTVGEILSRTLIPHGASDFCIPATSTTLCGFLCYKLQLALPTCGFQVLSSRLHVTSCHLQLTGELLGKIMGGLTTATTTFSCCQSCPFEFPLAIPDGTYFAFQSFFGLPSCPFSVLVGRFSCPFLVNLGRPPICFAGRYFVQDGTQLI